MIRSIRRLVLLAAIAITVHAADSTSDIAALQQRISELEAAAKRLNQEAIPYDRIADLLPVRSGDPTASMRGKVTINVMDQYNGSKLSDTIATFLALSPQQRAAIETAVQDVRGKLAGLYAARHVKAVVGTAISVTLPDLSALPDDERALIEAVADETRRTLNQLLATNQPPSVASDGPFTIIFPDLGDEGKALRDQLRAAMVESVGVGRTKVLERLVPSLFAAVPGGWDGGTFVVAKMKSNGRDYWTVREERPGTKQMGGNYDRQIHRDAPEDMALKPYLPDAVFAPPVEAQPDASAAPKAQQGPSAR